MNSILSPTTCGFARIAAYEIFSELRNNQLSKKCKTMPSPLLQEGYDLFNEQFAGYDYCVSHMSFKQNFKKMIENVGNLSKYNRKEDQRIILNTFSRKEWNTLPHDKKEVHKLFDCQGCISNDELKKALGSFFITTRTFKKLAEDRGIIKAKEVKKQACEIPAKVNQRTSIINKVNQFVPKPTLKKYKSIVRQDTVKAITK